MKLSALILIKNEALLIEECLKQLNFADEIIVLDQNSQDKSPQIAKLYTDKVHASDSQEFDTNRNKLLNEAKGEWVLYLDADERVDTALKSEIKSAINSKKFAAYYVSRKNFILGKWLKHGGWWPDYVPKLFRKSALRGWEGSVHESPNVQGEFGYLKNPLFHLTARDLSSMLEKTIKWAKIEAELHYQNKSPKVTSLKVIKAMVVEFINRYVVKRGFLDGAVGLVEAIFQSFHKAVMLTYLWEMQNESTKKSKDAWK